MYNKSADFCCFFTYSYKTRNVDPTQHDTHVVRFAVMRASSTHEADSVRLLLGAPVGQSKPLRSHTSSLGAGEA